MSRSIQQIRERLTPEQWLQGLRSIRANYEEQLVSLVADRDVVESVGGKVELLARIDVQLIDLDERITEIDERIGSAADGAMGLPRAARRRLKTEREREEKKVAAKVSKNGAKEEVTA